MKKLLQPIVTQKSKPEQNEVKNQSDKQEPSSKADFFETLNGLGKSTKVESLHSNKL